MGLFQQFQVHAHHHAFQIGKVADDAFDWFRQFSHERGQGDDLIFYGQLRLFGQINYFNRLTIGEMFLAQFFQIGKGGYGFGCLACDVKPQQPFRRLIFSVAGRLRLGLALNRRRFLFYRVHLFVFASS